LGLAGPTGVDFVSCRQGNQAHDAAQASIPSLKKSAGIRLVTDLVTIRMRPARNQFTMNNFGPEAQIADGPNELSPI
jgi:hypothetical protein